MILKNVTVNTCTAVHLTAALVCEHIAQSAAPSFPAKKLSSDFKNEYLIHLELLEHPYYTSKWKNSLN